MQICIDSEVQSNRAMAFTIQNKNLGLIGMLTSVLYQTPDVVETRDALIVSRSIHYGNPLVMKFSSNEQTMSLLYVKML